ncbi:type II toxin-antitoxin system ParD family antitoxin [Oceaniglobus roseus]|uniref:type II toxin-antitoxin system ParD family antitoxin n=1 Tax=Oceaniglobus roseus TaxID=1737570 RepID=UPI000C7EB1E8|nr:type II toxin-antitoxin system ParD family antitoxin [Kandeliimicrobium roseum]
MATMNVSLPEPMKAFAEAQAKGGRYANVSDYVRDLIRRDLERQEATAGLRALVEEGLASGAAEPFDIDDFRAEMHRLHEG